MTTKCRYHCGACGKHFTSEGGFESHRKGDHAKGRTCGDPDPGIPVQTDGECRISGAKVLKPVTVYGGAREEES